MSSNELVSILVLAYNSSETIIETLESIKNQDYRPLELVICDDSSKDNTVETCEMWIHKHGKNFASVKIARMAKNAGIPFNLNNGLKQAKGRWAKLIAGDDLLLPSCISDNMNYIASADKDIFFLYSKLRSFRMTDGHMVFLDFNNDEYDYIKGLEKLDSSGQYRKLLKRDILLSPTIFMHTETFKKSAEQTNAYPIEDWPMRLRVAGLGTGCISWKKRPFSAESMILYLKPARTFIVKLTSRALES
jgi:glycosyltransferase involved in cell wall biosynthesis